MTSDGSINSLGEQYIGAVTPNVSPDYVPGVVHGGSGSSGSSGAGATRRPLSMTEWRVILLVAVTAFLGGLVG